MTCDDESSVALAKSVMYGKVMRVNEVRRHIVSIVDDIVVLFY